MEKQIEHNEGLAPAPHHQEFYRGYLLEIARTASAWQFKATPRKPDLPLLAPKCSGYPSGIDALEEAIRHINRLLR